MAASFLRVLWSAGPGRRGQRTTRLFWEQAQETHGLLPDTSPFSVSPFPKVYKPHCIPYYRAPETFQNFPSVPGEETPRVKQLGCVDPSQQHWQQTLPGGLTRPMSGLGLDTFLAFSVSARGLQRISLAPEQVLH